MADKNTIENTLKDYKKKKINNLKDGLSLEKNLEVF